MIPKIVFRQSNINWSISKLDRCDNLYLTYLINSNKNYAKCIPKSNFKYKNKFRNKMPSVNIDSIENKNKKIIRNCFIIFSLSNAKMISLNSDIKKNIACKTLLYHTSLFKGHPQIEMLTSWQPIYPHAVKSTLRCHFFIGSTKSLSLLLECPECPYFDRI